MKQARKRTANIQADTARMMQRVANPLDEVFVERPRCPRCGSAALETLRSVADQGDGSTCRRTRCRGCDHRFNLILE